jgi:hypothetical protein
MLDGFIVFRLSASRRVDSTSKPVETLRLVVFVVVGGRGMEGRVGRERAM